jgi:hypothetical protein
MNEILHSAEDLQEIYRARFAGKSAYRQKVWSVLCSYFSRWISPQDAVLDLGAGHCEFINAVVCGTRCAMDLNLAAKEMANPDVTVIQQDRFSAIYDVGRPAISDQRRACLSRDAIRLEVFRKAVSRDRREAHLSRTAGVPGRSVSRLYFVLLITMSAASTV